MTDRQQQTLELPNDSIETTPDTEDARMTDPKPANWADDLTPADLGLVVPAFIAQELTRLRPDTDGCYAWDRWRLCALEAGLSDDPRHTRRRS